MSDLATNPQGGDAVASTANTGVDANDASLETEIENPELENPDNPEDDSEEIEHEGKQYRIPKAIKPLLMFQSDYTKKTQETADRGRTLDDREKKHVEQVKIYQANLNEIGEIHALRRDVANWDKVDWQGLRDKAQTVQDLAQIDAWKEQADKARNELAQKAGALKQKFDQQSLEDQRTGAKAIEEAHAAVAREIKDWPQTFDKASAFAAEFGFKPEEMKGVSDPRMLKFLHRAYQDSQAAKELAALKKAQAASAASPLPQVNSKSSAQQRRTTDSSGDGLSTAEWMKRENARELAKRKPN